MKRLLFVLSWVVLVPVSGFAQANQTPVPLITPPPTQGDSVGGAIGLVTSVNHEIITVKTEAANPMSFAIGKTAHFVDKKGRKIKQDRIKVGTRVRVYYEGNEDTRTATKIIIQG
jgi:hypothetical protein